MPLVRPIRVMPSPPSAAKLHELMKRYALRRSTVARLMRASIAQVRAYLRPPDDPRSIRIPLARWELIQLKLAAIYSPDEPLDLPL